MQLPPVPSPLDRPVALFILQALLSVFEPVLVLLAVGHGSAFERISCSQLFFSPSHGCVQVSPAQVGSNHACPSQVSPAQVGLAQVDRSQTGPLQVSLSETGLPQVGTAQIDLSQARLSETGLCRVDGYAHVGRSDVGLSQVSLEQIGPSQV